MTSFRKLLFNKMSQVLIDIVIFGFSWVAAYFVRFEGLPPGGYLSQMLFLALYIIAARILLFYLFAVYTIVWRYVSIRDALLLVKASVPLTMLLLALRYLAPLKHPDPAGAVQRHRHRVPPGDPGRPPGSGCSVGYRPKRRTARARAQNGTPRKIVLLIGAGDGGNAVLKELQNRSDLGMSVAGFVDDDPEKKGKNIQGVRVLGDTSRIPEFAQAYGINEAIITIANASSKDIRRIVEICQGAGLKVRIVPGIFEMLDDKVKITKVREVNIDDLLGRSVFQIEKHLPEVSKVYGGKRILVTGAGGSIGSELCRQLAAMRPAEIVLLDKDENSIFDIDNDLKAQRRDGVIVHPVIANIKNGDRLKLIFEKYRPEIVFHAAAHKHVPLMELNVSEAILNNVLGTINVVETAAASGVERFIFISTDKAVNPTSVMGATKKLGEIIVQNCAKRNGTKFSCVRFGNVLGSRGSVVPLFRKQIERGGPVTVTHPEMRRYFMSIAEAVHLIIQAGTLGEKGEIFVLDMGEPIKIVDMVKTLIRLSGHQGRGHRDPLRGHKAGREALRGDPDRRGEDEVDQVREDLRRPADGELEREGAPGRPGHSRGGRGGGRRKDRAGPVGHGDRIPSGGPGMRSDRTARSPVSSCS